MKFAIALAAAVVAATNALKVGVVSDTHTNLKYDSWASVDDNCFSTSTSSKEDDQAPIARIGCDPSTTMVDFMLRRFTEVFGDVDVLLVPGDIVSHDVAPRIGEVELPADLTEVEANISATTDLLVKYFPKTPVLLTIGNNDGYHSQAVIEDQKSDFYGFLMDDWFSKFPGNASLLNVVEPTVKSGGYYRADLSETLSVLSFNFEYMDNDDDPSYHLNEATEQLDWLESQLGIAANTSRKFVLLGHVYAGTRYHGAQLWHEDIVQRYFQILRDYHESIAIEVMGHDHYGDLRYHSSDNVLDLDDTDVKFDFHNVLVAPGVTPNKGNNPGVAMFELSADGVPSNLKFEFMDLVPQLGKSSVSYSDVKFLSLDMADYGVSSLDASSLSEFRKALEADKDMALEYLTRKMGFDATSDEETQMAYAVYEDKDLITSGKQKTGEYICQMHKSLSPKEFEDCCASANEVTSDLEVFLQ